MLVLTVYAKSKEKHIGCFLFTSNYIHFLVAFPVAHRGPVAVEINQSAIWLYDGDQQEERQLFGSQEWTMFINANVSSPSILTELVTREAGPTARPINVSVDSNYTAIVVACKVSRTCYK